MVNPTPSYYGYRFPSDIIALALRLYFRFNLSFQEVEDRLSTAATVMSMKIFEAGYCGTCRDPSRIRLLFAPPTCGGTSWRDGFAGACPPRHPVAWVPPAEFEQLYYQAQETPVMVTGVN